MLRKVLLSAPLLHKVVVSPGDRSRDGIVRTKVNRPVVRQESVRDLTQSSQSVGVLVRDGLVRNIAARQHNGGADRAEQEMVQRGVRQHESKPAISGCDGFRQRRTVNAVRQDNRPPPVSQQRLGR